MAKRNTHMKNNRQKAGGDNAYGFIQGNFSQTNYMNLHNKYACSKQYKQCNDPVKESASFCNNHKLYFYNKLLINVHLH